MKKLLVLFLVSFAVVVYAFVCEPTIHLAKTSGSTGTNWVSLPYSFDAPDTAKTVCDDIGVTANEVGKYNESSDSITSWTCGDARHTPFTLKAGEAVYVKVAAVTDWTPSK